MRARDRNADNASHLGAEKASKWPRTSRREERIRYVLERRQPTLTVVLEDVHDPHNASAVLRSCDGVGVLDVHMVYVQEDPPRKSFGRSTSEGSFKWLRIHWHDSIEECYAALRRDGFQIAATALTEMSRQVYDLDMTLPTALVFGNEKRGVSQAAMDGADATVYIPMQGMVESLNISVSCAVSLYEAMRQRLAAGMYDASAMDDGARESLFSEWIAK